MGKTNFLTEKLNPSISILNILPCFTCSIFSHSVRTIRDWVEDFYNKVAFLYLKYVAAVRVCVFWFIL